MSALVAAARASYQDLAHALLNGRVQAAQLLLATLPVAVSATNDRASERVDVHAIAVWGLPLIKAPP